MSGPRQHYFRKAGLKNKPRRKSSAILNISLRWENYTNCDKTNASERFVYVQMIAIYAFLQGNRIFKPEVQMEICSKTNK